MNFMKSVVMFCCLSLFAVNSTFAEHGTNEDTGDIYRLNDVVVSAERLSEYVKNHPQNIVTLDRKEIRERNFLGVSEALGTMPGVDVAQGVGSTGARISIRGSGGFGSVLVLVDGRPINSAQYGGVNLDSIPIEIVKSITVFKPPVPVWLGMGGSAGAINIVTKHNLAGDRKKDTRNTRLKMNGGSYGTANMSATYAMNSDKEKLLFTLGAGHSDGKRPNSDRDSGDASFSRQAESVSGIQYDLNARYYHSYHGSSGPVDNPTPDARQRYQKGALDFQANGFITDTVEFSLKPYFDVEDLNDKSQTGSRSTLEAYKTGISVETIWNPVDRAQVWRFGGLFETNRVYHNISGNHHRDKISLHVQHDREMGDLTATFGVRGDYTNDFNAFPAVNAGLSYALGADTIIKTTAGYSVEIPSFNQLYQPSHGSIDQVRGNPDLGEERIFSFDLSLEHKFSPDVVLNTSLFRTDTKDLIVYERGADLIYRPVNVSRAYKQGVEMSFKTKWSESLATDLCYIYQDTKNKKTGGELGYAPHHNLKVIGKYVMSTRTKIETTFKAVSRQYSSPDTAQSITMGGYVVVNLKMIHPVTIGTWQSELFVHIDNLLDTDFETHAGYPDDGFRFLAGMNINF